MLSKRERPLQPPKQLFRTSGKRSTGPRTRRDPFRNPGCSVDAPHNPWTPATSVINFGADARVLGAAVMRLKCVARAYEVVTTVGCAEGQQRRAVAS